MAQFWLVCGNSNDTHFYEALAPGENWNGPFDDYETARREWLRLAHQGADARDLRYRIERIDPEVPPHCTD